MSRALASGVFLVALVLPLLNCGSEHKSDEIYYLVAANTKLPFSVNDNVDHPISLYAATKKANELMAYSYSHLYRLPTTGLRFFTVYGPWGRPDDIPVHCRALPDRSQL